MNRFDDIRLLRITYLRGPNLWTYRSALEVWLDLGALEDWPSHRLEGFTQRLVGLLPALEEHHCGVGERGGFLQRLQEGTWMGHVLEHVVIELLNLAGMPTGFGQTRSTSMRGVYRMVFRARDEQVARAALDDGHRLLMAAINGEGFDVAAAVIRVRDAIDRCYLGPSTAHIVASATDRRIPFIRLNDGNLVQLGHGARQRRIWTAETERTSAIGESIARDKDLTKTLLHGCGVPVPIGRVAASPEAAWEIAQDLGLPVVVKPSDGNHGRGVTLDLRIEADIAAAWKLADQHGSEVIVERFVPGHEHRVLVVGRKVVAAAKGETAWIVGDGTSTVLQLIDAQLNADPRRGTTEDHPLNRLDPFEDEVIMLDLQRQGLTTDAVPAAGRRVLIQRNGNVAIDCTDQVHPEVEHAVTLAARIVGLDIAGIDVVCEDIGRPLHEQGGAIVEVNAGPGLLNHLKPAEGKPRPVGKAIVDHLFPEGETGRIPIVGISGGSPGTTTVARLVAWMLHIGGRPVGVACRDGVFLGVRRIDPSDGTAWDAGHRLLVNRTIEVAVFENPPLSVLRDGFVYDRASVGVVTDLQGIEALAEHDIRDEDQLLRVVRTQVDVVLAEGAAVLNADVPRLLQLAELSDGDVVLYARDLAHPALVAHRDRGGRCVSLRDGMVVLCDGASPQICGNGRGATLVARLGAEVVLPAVAAAWSLGLMPALIAAGFETYQIGDAVRP
jgi:cyanophycin synthetase